MINYLRKQYHRRVLDKLAERLFIAEIQQKKAEAAEIIRASQYHRNKLNKLNRAKK